MPSDQLSYYQCPVCGAIITSPFHSKEKITNAQLYSDSRRIVPNVLAIPEISICEVCDSLLWLKKIEKLSKSEIEKLGPGADIQTAKSLDIAQCFEIIEAKRLANEEEEFDLRIHIWQLYNDRIRNNQSIFLDEKDEQVWKSNLEKLLTLLDTENITEKIMYAEIHRNLGQFSKALEIIQSTTDEILGFKALFIEECNKGNRWVFRLV